MLEVYFGNDIDTVRSKAFSAVDKKKSSGMALVTLAPEEFTPGQLTEASKGTSLFGERSVYVVDTPSANAEMYEEVVTTLTDLAESEHAFVVIEGTLLAPEKKKFVKHAHTLEEYKTAAPKRFNTFALADALCKRDKRTLWLLLSEAYREGVAPEEIVGTLWWQLKTLRLAANTGSAAEAGMKDWPYNKAKQSLRSFKEGEVEALSESLLALHRDARVGETELGLGLERWVLSI